MPNKDADAAWLREHGKRLLEFIQRRRSEGYSGPSFYAASKELARIDRIAKRLDASLPIAVEERLRTFVDSIAKDTVRFSSDPMDYIVWASETIKKAEAIPLPPPPTTDK